MITTLNLKSDNKHLGLTQEDLENIIEYVLTNNMTEVAYDLHSSGLISKEQEERLSHLIIMHIMDISNRRK